MGAVRASRLSGFDQVPPPVSLETLQITGGRAARIDWEALEVPFWLSDRLDRLGFKFPTGGCVGGMSPRRGPTRGE